MSIIAFTVELAQSLLDSAEEFPVNFDDAWQWLEYSRKDVAKRNFMSCGFVEGIDFEIRICAELRPQGGYSNREEIRLTCDCVKQWGMMSGTPKGKEIRLYFLQCEKTAKLAHQPKTNAEMLVYYANQILEQERKLFQIEAKQQQSEQRIKAIEAEQDRYQHSSGKYYTVLAYARILGIELSKPEASELGKKASKLCKSLGIKLDKVYDPRYGKINTYPQSILKQLIKP